LIVCASAPEAQPSTAAAMTTRFKLVRMAVYLFGHKRTDNGPGGQAVRLRWIAVHTRPIAAPAK
jgi:hypothetical protein